MSKRVFTARYERDEDGYWTAVVKLGPKESAISDGPTLERCRKRIRQAVALALEVSESSIEIEEDVQLPAPAGRALRRFREAKEQLEAASTAARRATADAARRLSELGISRRDAGDLLGLTGARVHQVLEENT